MELRPEVQLLLEEANCLIQNAKAFDPKFQSDRKQIADKHEAWVEHLNRVREYENADFFENFATSGAVVMVWQAIGGFMTHDERIDSAKKVTPRT